jgi:electron transfer flavoprotein beta subunit
MAAAPLLCVCMKPVRRTDVPLRLDAAAQAPRAEESLLAPDPADLAALRLALELRGALPGARVLALSVAGPETEALLREGLAAGADEVLRVWGAAWPEPEPGAAPPLDASGGATRARALAAAAALRARAPALVLAGERSADSGGECFGAYLAAALGAAFAHRVTAVRPRPGGAGWDVTVRLERGYGQALALPAPAVATVSAQLPRPGYAALPAWLASRAAAVPVARVETPPPTPAPTHLRLPVPRVKRTHVPAAGLSAEERIQAMVTLPAGAGGTVLAGQPPEAQAEAILALLRERGYR